MRRSIKLAQKMPTFSVIIVNYNGGEYPRGAIKSLSKQTFRDFEVLFCDNASQDGSDKNLPTEDLPSFLFIKQDENLGFAAANNLCARLAKGKWIALLNPDAVAEPDWLEKLLSATEKHPDIVHFASTQYEMHRPDYLDGAGDNYHVIGFPWRGGYGRPADELPSEGYCFSPCGAGALYRRDVFLELDGFDERFFCYCEDVDLGYRMQLMGHDCVFAPEAVIHHAGGGISGKVSGFAVFYGTRNRLLTYVKNTPPLLLLLTLPFHLGLTALFVVRGFFNGNAKPTLNGLYEAFKLAPSFQAEAKWAAPTRNIRLTKLMRHMAWSPIRMVTRRVHVRDDS